MTFTRFETGPLPIPSWMVIDAARYALGRQSYQVGTTCDWLVSHWDRLPDHARKIVANDLAEAFARDDEARDRGDQYKPLGMDMDRRQWERVRALCDRDAQAGAGAD